MTGAEARDLPVADAWKFNEPIAFKGNMDIPALEKLLQKEKERIPLVILTITIYREMVAIKILAQLLIK